MVSIIGQWTSIFEAMLSTISGKNADRTRKDRSLQLSVNHQYDQPGEYTIVVKVIDILGNDTTKAVVVEVR